MGPRRHSRPHAAPLCGAAHGSGGAREGPGRPGRSDAGATGAPVRAGQRGGVGRDCGDEDRGTSGRKPLSGVMMPNKQAVFETAKGRIDVELFADEVPATVANFEKLARSEEHTSELQSHSDLVCRLLLEKKKNKDKN